MVQVTASLNVRFGTDTTHTPPTTLYNAYFDEPASQLHKLHNHLNDIVAEAYGFNDSDDILERLLERNLELADKEKRGEAVAGPQHYQ